MAKWAFLREPPSPVRKNQLVARWLMLLSLCMGLFGSYYVYDIPAATENNLATWFGEGVSNSTAVGDDDGGSASEDSFPFRFNLLYSVYSFPNCVLPFFGGLVSDKLGVRLTGVIFMGLIMLGQIITAVGCTISNADTAWYVMWLGRTVFGLGGESLSVAQSAFVAAYFQGKELAFAMGVNLALARVGSVINDVVSAAIATNMPVYYAYWVGAGITLLSFGAMVYAYYLDLACEQRLRVNAGRAPLEGEGLLEKFTAVFCGCCCRRRGGGGSSDDAKLLEGGGAPEPPPPTEEIHMSAVLRFPATFWVLTASCVSVYVDVLVFNNNSSNFIAQKYLVSQPLWQMTADALAPIYLKANSVMLITYLVSGFTTPLLGGAIDRLGGRAVLVAAAAVVITGLHAIFAFTSFYPIAPLVALGLCYSIYAAALWPSIAVVIEPKYQATAYGLTTALQNLGLALGPLVVAKLMPSSHCATLDACIDGWNNAEKFFVGCGLAGVAFGVLLNVLDACGRGAQRGILNAGAARTAAGQEGEEDDAGEGAGGYVAGERGLLEEEY